MIKTIAATVLTCLASVGVFAQQGPGISEVRRGATTQTVFSYRIESKFGTTTSLNVSGNASGKAEATLNLKSGSVVSNKFGNENGDASVVFTATPNGTNADLAGITGENLLLIDDGTSFYSNVESPKSKDGETSTGSASAYGTHSSSVIIEQGTQSFQSGFTQTF